MLINMIYYVFLFMVVFSIVNLVKSIRSKNKKINYLGIISTGIYFVYVILIYVLIFATDLKIGWSWLFLLFMTFIMALIMIINIIVDIVKLNKLQDNFKIASRYYILILIIPIICLLFSCVREYYYIAGGKLFLTYKYDVGIIDQKITNYVITDHSCAKISPRNDFSNGNIVSEQTTIYHFEYENDVLKIMDNYHEYEVYANDNIKNIIANNLSKVRYEKTEDFYERYSGTISVLGNTGYYIITDYLKGKTSNDIIVPLGERVYKNDKYICHVSTSGDLKEIILRN